MKNELCHKGVKGRSGRYPWGSGKNPFHHGQSSPSGKVKRKPSAKKINQLMVDADPIPLDENKKYMTNQELQISLDRIDKYKKMGDLAAKRREEQTLGYKLSTGIDKANNAANTVKKAGNVYNVGAAIVNAFGGTNLPKIDFGTGGGKKVSKTPTEKAKEFVDDNPPKKKKRWSKRNTKQTGKEKTYEMLALPPPQQYR